MFSVFKVASNKKVHYIEQMEIIGSGQMPMTLADKYEMT